MGIRSRPGHFRVSGHRGRARGRRLDRRSTVLFRVRLGRGVSSLMSETSPAALVDQTEVGSYFVATYPPFSVWTQDAVVREARPALVTPADPSVPLGVYLHIPFCRKRCHFCYFRVYTDKNAQEVAR